MNIGRRFKLFNVVFLLMLTCFWSACYSLKGISIDPSVKTFYVRTFDNRAQSAYATIAVDFTERLKDKIRNQTRLTYADVDPDVVFTGYIADYSVTSVAPKPGESTAFNRLTITVNLNYHSEKDTTNDIKNQNFSFFQDYPSTTNLLQVQDQLVKTIFDQILEDIFNKAFTNW